MSESKGDIEFQRAISSIPFEEEKKDEERRQTTDVLL